MSPEWLLMPFLNACHKGIAHIGGGAGGNVKSGGGSVGGVTDVIDRCSGGGGGGRENFSSGLMVLDTDEPADGNRTWRNKCEYVFINWF